MGSFRQTFYQIVFGTKNRKPTITPACERDLFNYIASIINRKNSMPYALNGIDDHIHIFTDIHPSVCPSDLVKEIKIASGLLLRDSGKAPLFEGWQDGYGIFTYSIREKEMIINYIRKQKQHHQKETFVDEYKRLLIEHGVKFDERYLF